MKDDDSSVVEVSCWCGGMTWPKYIHLRCNQHQQQYSTIYPNENLLKDMEHHEPFLYSFLSALLDIWKRCSSVVARDPNLEMRRLQFWQQQLWMIQLGHMQHRNCSCVKEEQGELVFVVLHYLLEWLLYKIRELPPTQATREEEVSVASSHRPTKEKQPRRRRQRIMGGKPMTTSTNDTNIQPPTLMTKDARKILNDWFDANIHHPYPSEAVKKDLAIKAGITLEQVNTFFGNKRMRTKRKLAKLFRNCEEQGSSNFSPRFRWQKMIFPQLVLSRRRQKSREMKFSSQRID